MEEAGRTSAPQHGLIVVGILVLVALIGVVAWGAGGDDVAQTVERAAERFPSPATTAIATTSEPATSVPATPAPTPSPTPAPNSAAAPTTTVATGPDIGALVPNIAAFAEPLASPDAIKAQVAQLLAGPRHDIASDDGVAALCAVVVLDGRIDVAGRWERDGRRVLDTDRAQRDAPGYGECVGNDGDLLDDGSYQYIATADDGAESGAGGFVVGATRLDQRFVNNGAEPICAIRIAPRSSRYFEAYVLDTPIGPEGEVTLPVAAVDQDVEAMSCRDGEVTSSFAFRPDADRARDLAP